MTFPVGRRTRPPSKAIDFARTNIELSFLSPEMAALGVRFVAGDLSESDYIAAALDHANTLPASAPARTISSKNSKPQGRLAIGHDPRRYWEKQ
jgi:hypothetical protein